VIRPLSELLIQKTLVERYPHLQEHQVSCHATHKEGERVHPCGRCEKCRRIVGMLLVLGGDPRRCGYSQDQIQKCLKDLSEKDVHQFAIDAQHLYAMLTERGLIDVPHARRKSVKKHDEVMKLRFDPERSPLDAIPTKLRKSLYSILMEHALGAVVREKRFWHVFDPLRDPRIDEPYAFDMATPLVPGKESKEPVRMGPTHLWGELTWPEAEARFQEVDIALLPVGSIEQHGPHLPLDTDAFDADYLAKHIAEACSEPKPLVLPPISYGVSYEHDTFKGTLSISNETLSRLVYEIGMSAAQNGIKKLIIINGHGGNNPSLNFAAQMITRDARIFVCVDTGETSDVDINKIAETPNDVHAGEIETSTSLAVRPHLVRMGKASKKVPRFSSRYLNFTAKRWVSWYAYTDRISKSGVLGDPTKASAKKGERIWQIMIAHLVALVEDLKNMTLDEIYQRRY
jgi:creatinine amidohydrolase/Fe(II)-dependent formamide hydrolase-like protein